MGGGRRKSPCSSSVVASYPPTPSTTDPNGRSYTVRVRTWLSYVRDKTNGSESKIKLLTLFGNLVNMAANCVDDNRRFRRKNHSHSANTRRSTHHELRKSRTAKPNAMIVRRRHHRRFRIGRLINTRRTADRIIKFRYGHEDTSTRTYT